jgi:hypothetical protein
MKKRSTLKFTWRLAFLLVACLLFSFVEDDNRDVTVFEKVYLHLDRHFYLSGDDIWFKAYLIDAQTAKLSQKSSRILYAELISPESKILMRRVLYVDSDGCSIGDFKLKENAVSGKYRIRAYTKWMLNFGDVFVFEKEIEVQNINREREPDAKKKGRNKSYKTDETVISREDVEIQFFPESGSLIVGIENTVAFKANDWSGKGAEVSGGVLDSNSDTVALFTGEYLGMGKFAFTPKAGESYQAFFAPKDMRYSFFAKLPEPLDKGFTLNITDSDTAFILNIRTNQETFGEFSGKKLLLTFRKSEKPLFGHEITVNDNSEFLNLPKSLLTAGITRLTLYDEQGKPHCERLVYIENREQTNVSIRPADDTTSIIKVTDGRGQPLKAYLSMSITNSIIPDEMFDIESYFLFESEIRGKIERPLAYFDTANADRFRQIDLLLLTQGWRDFVWKQVENNASGFTDHEMEKGLKISGHVEKLIGKRPYPDANISLYFPHFGFMKDIRYTKTDSHGDFNFGYVNFMGYKMMHIGSRTEKGKKTGEISVNPLYMPAEDFPVKVWKQYQPDSTYVSPVENYKKKDYLLSDTIVLDPVTITDRKDGYMMSDREITPKDDSRWMSLDYYLKGQASALLKAKVPTCVLNSVKITFYDSNGKKMKSRVPHPSKISMKEIDRVRIYNKEEFPKASEIPFGFMITDFTRSIYSVDVYSKNDGFTEHNYATRTSISDMSEGARIAEIKIDDGYFEENIQINPDYYDGSMPRYEGHSRGLHTVTVDNVDYSSISSLTGGFYEERKFYTPQFHSAADAKEYFGTYFWQADIRTGTNGEGLINYNPEKQPSGKIRIEGITGNGIPFAVKLKTKG